MVEEDLFGARVGAAVRLDAFATGVGGDVEDRVSGGDDVVTDACARGAVGVEAF
jgi:hypothetical protein